MTRYLLLSLLAASVSAQTPPLVWHVEPVPLLRLGGDSATGPTEFANPYAAAFLAHQLIVLDGQSQTLRVFSLPDGRFVRPIGRKGNGPGEFQNAAYLQPLPGDSLFVGDIVLNRYSIFDPAGHEARTVSFASLIPNSRLTPVGRFADGTVLAWAPRFDAIASPGIKTLTTTIYRVSADGSKRDSLRTLPFVKVNSAPFQKGWGYRALLGAGQLTPAVAGGVAVFNSPTSYALYRYDSTGHWQTLQEPRPVRLGTGADGERLRAAAVAQGASATYMASVPVADTLPAIHYLLMDASGQLYVVEGGPPDASERIVSVYAVSGHQRARFTIPASFHLLAATDSLIVLTEGTPESAPTIQVYRLLKP